MSSLDKDEDRRPLGVVQSFIVTQKTSKKELCKLCSLRRQLWHVFTILPSHRGRFTMSPSTSNQKGIFCSSSFLMSIFCEKSGYFILPGGVCTCAYACVCMCVSAHEWWGIWQSESRFNNNWYIPGCFQTWFQLGAVCDASRPQSEREKMRERKG